MIVCYVIDEHTSEIKQIILNKEDLLSRSLAANPFLWTYDSPEEALSSGLYQARTNKNLGFADVLIRSYLRLWNWN